MRMVFAPTPDDALALAVRLCCVGQLIGLLELGFARRELKPGGFLDWSMIGIMSPTTRTRAGSFLRRVFRRATPKVFIGLVIVDAIVVSALLVWPSQALLIATAAALQVMLLKRHHLTYDGSDQMMLVVLVACLLGRVGPNAVSPRAAVSFVAAEVTLAYLVAGVYKATSKYWRPGGAFSMIVQTRMFGQPIAARVVRDHPAVGRAATYAVVCVECLFPIALIGPPLALVAFLALGFAFHLGCSVIMGLNRFLWAFVATYPALVCTNLTLRAELGAPLTDVLTLVSAGIGALALLFALGPRPLLIRHAGLLRRGISNGHT